MKIETLNKILNRKMHTIDGHICDLVIQPNTVAAFIGSSNFLGNEFLNYIVKVAETNKDYFIFDEERRFLKMNGILVDFNGLSIADDDNTYNALVEWCNKRRKTIINTVQQ